jgi:hypothetical protein
LLSDALLAAVPNGRRAAMAEPATSEPAGSLVTA